MAGTPQLDDPAGPEFRLRMIASDSDMDELGHVSNIAYVRWIQDVAVAHSHAVGWDHDAYKALDIIFVVSKHEVEYLRSAFAGDEIELSTCVTAWRGAVSERRTHIIRVSDGTLLVRAATRWALVNTNTHRPTRIPRELEAAFGAC